MEPTAAPLPAAILQRLFHRGNFAGGGGAHGRRRGDLGGERRDLIGARGRCERADLGKVRERTGGGARRKEEGRWMRTCEACESWHPWSTHESDVYRVEKEGDAGDVLRVGPTRWRPHMSLTFRVWQRVQTKKSMIQRL